MDRKPPRRTLAALVTLTATFGFVQPTLGQSGSTITGTIRNAVTKAPIAEVTVSIVNPSEPVRSHTAMTNESGVYWLPALPPAIYDVTATRAGVQVGRYEKVRLPLARTLTLDFTISETGGADPFTVEQAAPVVDVTATAFTKQFVREELENLPFSALNQLPSFSPGVTSRLALGGAPDTNQFMIDGSATVLTFHAGAAGAAFHPYWIDEAQILGGGANADVGEFTGVLTNVAIRSGANRFSGLLEYRTTPARWVADNTGSLSEALREQFRPQKIISRWATLHQIGGPIVRDRVFFFTGFHFNRNKFFQSGTIGNVPQQYRWPTVVSRVNATASKKVRLDAYFLSDRYHATGVLGRNQLPETAGDNETPIYSWNERLTWTLNERTVIELRNNGLDLQFAFIPKDRRDGPPPRRDRITQILSGNAASFGDEFGRRLLTGAHVTQLLDGALGRHELRGGIENDRMRFRSVSGIPGGRLFTDVDGVPEQVVLWDGSTVRSSGQRTTFHLQDHWKPASRLSIDAGTRVSFNRGAVPDKATVFRTNPISPRVGVAWDVWSDHRTVVRASYGRFHEGLYPSVYDFRDASNITPQITARVLGPETFRELNRTTTTSASIADDVAHAYVDEYVAGVEREVAARVSVKAQYIRRRFDDIWAFVDVGTQYAPVARQDPGADGRLGTTDDGSVLTVFNQLNPGGSLPVLTTPTGAFRRYDAIQFVGEKHVSGNWQLLAAYTWSRASGTVNAANQENKANGADTGRGGVFLNPNRALNADGRSAFDTPHQLNVQWTYLLSAWGGATVSGNYRYLSGGAWGRVATITGLAQGNQNVRIEPRGTRRINASSVLDVRLEKTMPLGSRRTAGVYVDLFNVLNQGVPMTVQEISGATFGQPMQWLSSRTAQIAARFKF